MEKTKKILMIISLSTLAIAVALLIAQVLGLEVFDGVLLRFLLIDATLALSCGFAISELSVISRKKILGYVGLGFLAVSTLLALITFSTSLFTSAVTYNRITGILSIFSVLFIIIISLYTKIGSSMMGLQIPTYICLIALDIMISLLIAGVKILNVDGMLEVLIILCVLNAGLLIALSVISAKSRSIQPAERLAEKNKGNVSREEYEKLLAENAMLKEEIAKLKNEK